MEKLVAEAINLIEANKISSTEIGDVLGKTGQIEGVYALNRGLFKVGEVAFIYAINNSNYEVHRQLAEKDIKGKILFVHNINCDRAVFGDLVTKYIMLYKQAKAIVINGKVTEVLADDGEELIPTQTYSGGKTTLTADFEGTPLDPHWVITYRIV